MHKLQVVLWVHALQLGLNPPPYRHRALKVWLLECKSDRWSNLKSSHGLR